MDKEFLSVREIADMLGVTIDTIQAYIRRKELVAFKIGNKYVVKRDELNRFLEKRRSDRTDTQDKN